MRSLKVWRQIVIVAVLSLAVILQSCAPLPSVEDEVTQTTPKMGANTLTDTPWPPLDQEPTSTNQPTETTLPTPDPVATSTMGAQEDTQEGVVLAFKRSGGFAGLDEGYTIYLGGRITRNDGREIWTDPNEVDLLVQEIEKLGVFELDSDYFPKDTCCDRFFYELTVYSGDQIITVRTIDAAPNAPDQLWAVLRLVQNFLDENLDK